MLHTTRTLSASIIVLRVGQTFQTFGRSYMASNYELRTFATGATRDTAQGKYDYEGFLNPLVLRRYAEFMHKNRVQPDGSYRDSDNWQLGIPKEAYMKSLLRHIMELWTGHRRGNVDQDVLCACMFNVMGYLLEDLKDEEASNRERK